MTPTAARWPVPLVLLPLLLAGCDGSSSKSATPAGSTAGSSTSAVATPSSSTPPPGFASTSAGTPKGVLSQPDFLIRMNEVCSTYDAKLRALPEPQGATDFDSITTNLTETLRLAPAFLSQAEALVRQTGERAALEENWLTVDRADFAVFKPIAQRMILHSKARSASKVQADADALAALPDHSSTVAAYLRGYGLASCARLESE